MNHLSSNGAMAPKPSFGVNVLDSIPSNAGQTAMKQHENKMNMFHLKDVITKTPFLDDDSQNSVLLLEKFTAIAELKKNIDQNVFLQVMRILLQANDFCRIPEEVIQIEIINMVASSSHFSLIDPLLRLVNYFNNINPPSQLKN
jgi:hypothetical protein